MLKAEEFLNTRTVSKRTQWDRNSRVLTRVLELFGQLVNTRSDSGLMESNNFFFRLVTCVTIEDQQEDCEKQNPVSFTVSNLEINPSLTFSSRHYEAIFHFCSNFKHAHLAQCCLCAVHTVVSPCSHSLTKMRHDSEYEIQCRQERSWNLGIFHRFWFISIAF